MSKERGPATSICRNSKRLLEKAAMREDPSLKNLKED